MVLVAKFIHLFISEILSTYYVQSVMMNFENAELGQA